MGTVKKAGTRKKKEVVSTQARQMIANVYRYLKEEYKFTELYLEPNCDISHLRNITMRTAAATKVSERTVQEILKEERDGESTSSEFNSPKHNQRKKAKIKEEIETDSEGDNVDSKITVQTISKVEKDAASTSPNISLPINIQIKTEKI
uniref:Uncharacterized protein n=1 Tax=Heliothis virescens TaxID=7102 RepID=A0A2A4J7G5_HELVI